MYKKEIAKVMAVGVLGLNLFGMGDRVNLRNQTTSSATPESRLELEDRIENKLENKINERTQEFINRKGILLAKVTSKDATSITVDNNGVSVKVNITSKTQFRRRFWGKSSLDEIKVGDKVGVVGRWVNEGRTEINAVVIRNMSVMRRFGAFFGVVKSTTTDSVVITTIHRGEETVTISSSTKLIDREEKVITFSDLKVGDKIRVKGTWDKEANTITEVAEIKDFSIPSTK